MKKVIQMAQIAFLVNEHKDWYSSTQLSDIVSEELGDFVDVFPVSDGGDGLTDALSSLGNMNKSNFYALNCEKIPVKVK